MLCLHGKPAVASKIENGTFWTCSEPSACFVCSEEEKHLYDKAIKAFLATKQDRPRCCGIVPGGQKAYISGYWANRRKCTSYEIHDEDTKVPKRINPYKYLGPFVSAADAERHYAKFRVYTGKERYIWWSAYKEDIGRPFFTCGKNVERDPRGCAYFEWGDKNIVTMSLCYHGSICKVKGKAGERVVIYMQTTPQIPRQPYGAGFGAWGPRTRVRRRRLTLRLRHKSRANPMARDLARGVHAPGLEDDV